MDKVRFGANFVPSKNWFHSWVNWDSASIEEDLIATKELGCDHIRAHLMWHYFQLDTHLMSPVCMKNLLEFRHICEKVNIDFCLSLFTGFMSGLFFMPPWIKKLTGDFFKGLYKNPDVIKAQEYYIREIAAVVADSPNFLGFDLGNELSCVGRDDPTTTLPERDAWNTQMLNLCEELAPDKLHNNGVDHKPWFQGVSFSRETLSNTGGITPLHCYSSFTGAQSRFGVMSEESVYLAPFMVEMAKAFCENPDKKYWIQEFGTAGIIKDCDKETFVIASLNAMLKSKNLWGITWWCTHNISKEFSSFDSIEYELGLLDLSNKPTKAGELFKRFVADYRATEHIIPQCSTAIAMEPFDSNGNVTSNHIWEIGHRYAECIREGIYPQIILQKNVDNAEYLHTRGIEKIIKTQ